MRIKEFFQYAETHISTEIEAITTADIINYHQHIEQRPSKKDGKALNQKTVSDHMRNIQDLYSMLQATGKIMINPANTINIQYPKDQSPRIALTQEEIKELYHHTQTYEERAILALAYGCGLRVSELVQSNIEDIRIRDGYIVVQRGKGNKGRIVPMSPTVKKHLANYFYKVRLQQESKDRKAFILHKKGKRMQKGTYNGRLQKLIKRTENETLKAKQISIHNLRHSIATHLIEQGIPMERVKEFLGHSQLETTEVYTHVSQQQLKQLIK